MRQPVVSCVVLTTAPRPAELRGPTSNVAQKVGVGMEAPSMGTASSSGARSYQATIAEVASASELSRASKAASLPDWPLGWQSVVAYSAHWSQTNPRRPAAALQRAGGEWESSPESSTETDCCRQDETVSGQLRGMGNDGGHSCTPLAGPVLRAVVILLLCAPLPPGPPHTARAP